MRYFILTTMVISLFSITFAMEQEQENSSNKQEQEKIWKRRGSSKNLKQGAITTTRRVIPNEQIAMEQIKIAIDALNKLQGEFNVAFISQKKILEENKKNFPEYCITHNSKTCINYKVAKKYFEYFCNFVQIETQFQCIRNIAQTIIEYKEKGKNFPVFLSNIEKYKSDYLNEYAKKLDIISGYTTNLLSISKNIGPKDPSQKLTDKEVLKTLEQSVSTREVLKKKNVQQSLDTLLTLMTLESINDITDDTIKNIKSIIKLGDVTAH